MDDDGEVPRGVGVAARIESSKRPEGDRVCLSAASPQDAVRLPRLLRRNTTLPVDLVLPGGRRHVLIVVPDPRQARLDDLSPQETRVLEHVAAGRTNKEIARILRLSEKTVKNYLSNAFQKLQVRRRSRAAAVFSRRNRA